MHIDDCLWLVVEGLLLPIVASFIARLYVTWLGANLLDNSTGQALLDVVFRHLDLLETAYFGLRYVDQDNQTHWLEAGKRLRRQLRGSEHHVFYFGVKFYAADPCKLLEEITRYQLFLQVKQDVLRGRLPVNFDLAAELAAYVLQCE
ncbi:Band 4.1-like protein 4A [Eumeta japonica]|uniref:Band 4.1-like protein 4A n=1 Tax=Eumeta variegata TaxID=151549 RepID=A0A4C1ZLM2_EUMVA|nr:Band 4.1-like protein 4A [Eumeta japonica]